MNDPRSARDVATCEHNEVRVSRVGGHDFSLKMIHCADCDCILWPAKTEPSPREALRDLIAKLAVEAKSASERCCHTPGDHYLKQGEAFAYGQAITLIRSMAGHLMEETQ